MDERSPLIMGVVNASPDSFSDDSGTLDLTGQREFAHALAEQGADLIDVGGESGRSDTDAISARRELDRVLPLVHLLVNDGLLVSVDTWKPDVATAVLTAGAAMINDVSGLRDPRLASACAEVGAGLVLTHTRAVPKQKAFPHYEDVVSDVINLLRAQIEVACAQGVRLENIVVDPGPDLGKTPAQTVEVLRRLDALRVLGRPTLLAVSRKDFIGAVTSRSPGNRLAGTLAAIGFGLDSGAGILRVHDVAAVGDYLKVRSTLAGLSSIASDMRLPEGLQRESS